MFNSAKSNEKAFRVTVILGIVCVLFFSSITIKANPPEGTFEYSYDNAGNRIERIYVPDSQQEKRVVEQTPEEAPEDKAAAVSIYPNPIADFFYVGIPTIKHYRDVFVTVRDMEGNTVINRKKATKAITKLKFKQLHSAGLYFLTVEYDGEAKTYKVIKAK